MARSFYSAAAGEEVADFYNPASDTHYSMFRRDGRYFQRRWQIGFDGKETNSEAMPVDFVMGSGNHARTYLSGTSRGTLIQLPLGWYAEKRADLAARLLGAVGQPQFLAPAFPETAMQLTTAPAGRFKATEHKGKIAAGMDGDLTVLSADPSLGDMVAFTHVKYTIRSGRVIAEKR